jgi:hypothetical protein
MTQFIEVLFILQFLIVLAISFYKLYNIISVGQAYNTKISFLLFIGFCITWGVGFMTVMFNSYTLTSDLLFIQLFGLENLLFGLNLLFFIIELIMLFAKVGSSPVRPYNAMQNRIEMQR